MTFTKVFGNKDLFFYLSDFLDDETAFRLFNTNKENNQLLKENPKRYTIKNVIKDTNIIANKYNIEKYLITKKTIFYHVNIKEEYHLLLTLHLKINSIIQFIIYLLHLLIFHLVILSINQ